MAIVVVISMRQFQSRARLPFSVPASLVLVSMAADGAKSSLYLSVFKERRLLAAALFLL
jgi:hypothetical protein